MIEQQWLKLIENEPNNRDLRLAFAEWLQDELNDPRAEMVMVQLRKGWKPDYFLHRQAITKREIIQEGKWRWWSQIHPPLPTEVSPESLPREIYVWIQTDDGKPILFTSRTDADQALWAACIKAKENGYVFD